MNHFFWLFIFPITSLFCNQSCHVLIGSPIRQKPAILKEFLESLSSLNQNDDQHDYYFIDDNDNIRSTALLQKFSDNCQSHCLIETPTQEAPNSPYVCNEVTHYWNDHLIWKVANFKDRMIHYAKEKGYDYLFLIDSDLVLHPNTILQLKKADEAIVSNVFWTAWNPGSIEQPQVWLSDLYNQYEIHPGETLSSEEAQLRTYQFLNKLKTPGTYEVGGLGACTLINKEALHKGISFQRLHNITMWGEDRHFCVRAVALGLSLHVDTHYPSLHLYREEDLAKVHQFKRECGLIEGPQITLSMIVKDEANNYLREVLQKAREYITQAVIIDDASTDDTVAVCKEELSGIPLTIIQNDSSLFSHEVNLRKKQWEETLLTNPEWILSLDADEIFENKFKEEIATLLTNTKEDAIYFRLYDLWDDHHYRSDSFWLAHNYYRPFLIRYKPGISYLWKETAQHCGRLPLTVSSFPYINSSLRLKHFGWANEDKRKEKMERYQKLDPDCQFGWKEQYQSILDPNPQLIAWEE